MKSPKELVNATLNEILLHVFAGADYVSKIALATGKSIPVVHRQLDRLVQTSVLTRARQGKRVVYGINWTRMADVLSSITRPDTASGTKADEKTLADAAKEFLANRYVRELMQDFFTSFKPDDQPAGKQTLRQSLQQFLDAFGMLSDAESEALAKKMDASPNVKLFLAHVRANYARLKQQDPRMQLAQRIRGQIQ